MKRKKIAAIVLFGLTLTTCSTPASGQMTQQDVINYTSDYAKADMINFFKDQEIKQTMLQAQAAKVELVHKNTLIMNKAIKSLNKYVGKTWYVFSGNTPRGWDCSGLTMWFYEQQGIALEHRATKQAKAGKATKSPKIGDIVVFKYKGSASAYHVGIYIGNGKMIHAPKHGHVTRIENVDTFAGNYSNVSYRTIVETN